MSYLEDRYKLNDLQNKVLNMFQGNQHPISLDGISRYVASENIPGNLVDALEGLSNLGLLTRNNLEGKRIAYQITSEGNHYLTATKSHALNLENPNTYTSTHHAGLSGLRGPGVNFVDRSTKDNPGLSK